MKLLHTSTLDMDLDGPDKNNCEVSKVLMSFFSRMHQTVADPDPLQNKHSRF
jgi:hypothetical protein